MEGQVFGRLTVLSLDRKDSSHRKYWVCRCSCGESIITRGDNLTSQKTQSCGCIQKEKATELCLSRSTHGLTDSRIYRSWYHMLGRCNNPNDTAYQNYGGRGIKVCDRWHTFANFLEDMGEMPKGSMIERRNNDGGYEPNNCYWATHTQQVRNRRNTVNVLVNGCLKPLAEYAEDIGLPYKTVYSRHFRGRLNTQIGG